MDLNKLSLEEKIGQMFMVGLEENNKATLEFIKEHKIGGVILYRKNYNNYNEMLNLINKIKETNKQNNIPIFISVDQEGGRVNRMPMEILNMKSAARITASNNLEVVRNSGKVIGEMLKKTGITMDYAPVFDIQRFSDEHAIGNRCYGKNKEDVCKYAIEVMKEIQKEGVIPVIKHFPGHGLTTKDTHFNIPKITQKIEILEKEDMVPFQKAIEENADAIMVGHLVITDIDKKYPASLSKKVIQEYLIKKYNYKGLIITDDLKMMAIRLHYNMENAVFKAIEAGNDIIMIGLAYRKVSKIIKYIVNQVKKGNLSIDRINESVDKILAIKKKYNINDEYVEGINIKEINDKIKEINDKC